MKFIFTLLSVFLFSFLLFAQEVAQEIPPQEFLNQVLTAIKAFGGLSTVAKISTIILIIISSMKVSFLNQLLWSKLGEAKVWVAPLLGLVGGILDLGLNGTPITLASVMAYVAAGAGAILLHELLDSLKAVPGIKDVYIKAIDFIKKILGGKPSTPKLP